MKHSPDQKYFLILFLLIASCTSRYPGPLSPEEALKSFALREGFRIELLASEPLVRDPVCMEFDEQGNIYVVEMPDYPYKPETDKAKGRIVQLKDTDNDGEIDESVIFADSLMEATSILPWKGGLIVTTAPHILYLKDMDGDGQADIREVLYSGFFDQNSEAQITSLSFGVDNWIYAANNGQAGEVSSARDPNAPVLTMSGADFRFRMDRNQFERTTGSGQFGQTLDDWGNRFITQNTLHIQHTAIPWKYWHRHPYLPSFKSAINISDHELEMFQATPPPYWRAERTRRRNKDFQERKLDRVEYAEDHFTGASGGTIYTGDGFPKEYYGNVFTGDVAGNLVHRDVVRALENSPTFVASRDDAEKDREFLASTDSWFRPANFAQGPDGYLYLIDFYRQHIETPVSIPDDLKKDMDFMNGSERGRIYRILPAGATTENRTPDLQHKSTPELVKLLAHPGRWWRLQAQRLLLERQDPSAVPDLLSLFEKSDDPKIRLHALYALEGLNALTPELAKKALGDASPGLREHGLILSERFPGCLDEALAKLDDPSIKVAFQATLTAGDFHGQNVSTAMAHVVTKYGQDPLFQMAVLSSDEGSSAELLKLLITKQSFFTDPDSWKVTFMESLAYVIGSRNDHGQVASFLNALSGPPMENNSEYKKASVNGLLRGLKKSQTATDQLKEQVTRMEADSIRSDKEKILELSTLYPESSDQ